MRLESVAVAEGVVLDDCVADASLTRAPTMPVPRLVECDYLLGPGVFILSHRGRITYVGKARRLLAAISIYESRNNNRNVPSWFPIKHIQFDSIQVIPCDVARSHAIAESLISHYDPIHNRQPTSAPPSAIVLPPNSDPQPIRRTL